MNELTVFENSQFGQMRTIMKDGEAWFVAADVCRALEIGETHVALRRLDEDEKGRYSTPTLGGEQEMSIINEPGLYSLVLGSRKPEARAFKRWITHEILPTLRRTGAYAIPVSPRFPDAQGGIRVFRHKGVEYTTLKDLADFMGESKYNIRDQFNHHVRVNHPEQYFAAPTPEARRCYQENGYPPHGGRLDGVVYFITQEGCRIIARGRQFDPDRIDRAWNALPAVVVRPSLTGRAPRAGKDEVFRCLVRLSDAVTDLIVKFS